MNDMEKARARRLLATVTKAVEELGLLLGTDSHGEGTSRFDDVDRARRRRPEWRRRGRVFYAIAQAGGRVDMLGFIRIILDAGYSDMRGVNGFFRGDPIPVCERDGDDVVLTERGRQAARFYEAYWLPQEDEAA